MKEHIHSESMPGFKSWAGLEAAFLICGGAIAQARVIRQGEVRLLNLLKIHPPEK